MVLQLASSRLEPVLLTRTYPSDTAHIPCRTGFSREHVGRRAAELMVLQLASSRLKPVLLTRTYPSDTARIPPDTARIPCRTGFSREHVGRRAAELMVLQLAPSRLKPVLLTYHRPPEIF
jgi:hypothetical protein